MHIRNYPCSICCKGVGSNSAQCTKCQHWVHKRCSGVHGNLTRKILLAKNATLVQDEDKMINLNGDSIGCDGHVLLPR